MAMQTGIGTVGNGMEWYIPVKPLLSIYPNNMKANMKRFICTNINSSTVCSYQVVEPVQVPFNRWIDREIVEPILNGIFHGCEGWTSSIWDKIDEL